MNTNPIYSNWLETLKNESFFTMRSRDEYLRWGYYKLQFKVLRREDSKASVKYFLILYDTYTISLEGGKSDQRIQHVIGTL